MKERDVNDAPKKKRDNEVVAISEEKPKKLRANKSESDQHNDATARASAAPNVLEEEAGPSSKKQNAVAKEKNYEKSFQKSPARESVAAKEEPTIVTNHPHPEPITFRTMASSHPLDLEAAIQRVVKPGNSSDETTKEYLDRGHWIVFRQGHAGDVSDLAALYRSQISSPSNSSSASSSEDTSLEVRLAEGFGDEDTPPSIVALLVDVFSEEDADPALGGAAILSSGLHENMTRILRVEWMAIDRNQDDVLQRRLWLRLGVLAKMTASSLFVVDQNRS